MAAIHKKGSECLKRCSLRKTKMFFGNIIFIAMGEINELWKIHNNLEKAEVPFFIKMDVDFQ